MRTIAFIGLVKIEFPDYELRLCDGGFVDWGDDRYLSRDPVFGVIGAMETIGEGVGEEVPVIGLTLLPPSETPTSTLAAPGYQTSRVRFWLAELDVDTGTLDGTPELQLDGQIDQITLAFGL